VEVVFFGRLGASVDIIAKSHDEDDVLPEDEPPLGRGLIKQNEIHYFRQRRNNLDVVIGEVLPAYVEKVREDGKVDISLRPVGYVKSVDLAEVILNKLEWTREGILDVGDKSTPKEISTVFPGASKASFKKAVANLYKRGIVKPGPYSVTLMRRNDKESKA